MDGYNGGRLSIPDDKHDAFIDAYTKDIETGNKLYISELGTKVFNMFIDFDKFFDVLLQVDIVKIAGDWADVIVSRLHVVFENVEFETLVSTADMKLVKRGRTEHKKYGVHMNFDGLLVTSRQALEVRRILINVLQRDFPVDESADEIHQWTLVLDEAVYKNPGLRMTGSRKASKHSECEKKKRGMTKCSCIPECCGKKKWRDKCQECKNAPKCEECVATLDSVRSCEVCAGRKIDEGRPYTPKLYYDACGVRDDTAIDGFELIDVVRKTVIRTLSTKHYMLFAGNDLYDYCEDDERMVCEKRKRDGGKFITMPNATEETSCSCGGKATCDFCLVAANIALQIFIERDVAKELGVPVQFAVDSVMYIDSDKGQRTFTASSNCRYCTQKDGEHSNNRTYFLATVSTGVRQKCHSEGCTGISKSVRIPASLKKILWPLKYKKVPKYVRIDTRNTPQRMFEDILDFISLII
jgi:hypothetical protein